MGGVIQLEFSWSDLKEFDAWAAEPTRTPPSVSLEDHAFGKRLPECSLLTGLGYCHWTQPLLPCRRVAIDDVSGYSVFPLYYYCASSGLCSAAIEET